MKSIEELARREEYLARQVETLRRERDAARARLSAARELLEILRTGDEGVEDVIQQVRSVLNVEE